MVLVVVLARGRRAGGAAAASVRPSGRLQVENRRAGGAEKGALVGGRHVAAGPVLGPADRAAGRVEHDDEAGQVLVDGAQAVVDPRAQAGAAADRILPEFICSMAEPWIGESAVIEWRKAMSSTQVARLGNRSLRLLAALAVLLELPFRADDAALVLRCRRGRRS